MKELNRIATAIMFCGTTLFLTSCGGNNGDMPPESTTGDTQETGVEGTGDLPGTGAEDTSMMMGTDTTNMNMDTSIMDTDTIGNQ